MDNQVINIRTNYGYEILSSQLKIGSGKIITDDMLQGLPREGEVGSEFIQEEIDLDSININSAPGMLLSSNVINAITQYIETTIQSFIADNTEQNLALLGINTDTLKMTEQILTLINNANSRVNSILKFVPTNIKMIPDSGSLTRDICTSLKDMYMAIWLNIRQQYHETINDALTNLPTAQEALAETLKALQTLAEDIINQQCIRYTGKTLVELRYMCYDVIAKYKKYREKVKLARQGIEQKTQIISDFDIDTVKMEFQEQLAICSDLVYNSFMILEIKESIENIIQLVQEFNNIDVNSLAVGINQFSDFMDLLDEMGLDSESNIINLEEAIKAGFNTIRNNFEGLTSQLAAQALNSAAQISLAAVNNSSVNYQTITVQNYSFDLDIDTRTLFIIFDKEPTTRHIIKNLTSALRHAENNEKQKVFDSNQIQRILNLISKGVFDREDKEEEIGPFNIKIKFNLENYNKNKPLETIDSSLINTVDSSQNNIVDSSVQKKRPTYENSLAFATDFLNHFDEIKAAREQEESERYREFSLGVIEEEYSEDPNQIKRRPTLQLVHELYSILKEMFPILKIVITLVSNYKINKEKVKNNAQGNLFGMVRFIAKINNFLQTVDTTNKNFYTVRTLKTYNFINEKIKPFTNIETDMELNNDETVILYNFLKENKLGTNDINKDLTTILFFDMESINEQNDEYKNNIDTASEYFGEDTSMFVNYPTPKYSDGTITGLDKIQKAGNDIYYSNSSLPIIGSQILRAYSKNLDVSF